MIIEKIQFNPGIFFDMSLDLMCLVDRKGHIVKVNPAFGRYTGYSDLEIVGKRVDELIHPDFQENTWQILRNLKLAQPSVYLENKIKFADGQYKDTMWKLSFFDNLFYLVGRETSNTEGTKEQIQELLQNEKLLTEELAAQNEEIMQNLEELKATQDYLEEKEKNYRELYNNTPAIMCSVNQNGLITDVSDHWLKVMGVERAQVIGKEYIGFVEEASRPYIRDIVIPALFREETWEQFEFQLIKGDGTVMDVMAKVSHEKNQEGRITKFHTVHTDISLRKKAEKEIVRSERHLKAIINATSNIIFLLDEQAKVISFNQQAEQSIRLLTGKRIEAGNHLIDILPAEETENLTTALKEVMQGKPLSLTRQVTFSNSIQRWLEIKLYPVKQAAKGITNIVFNAQDITELKRSEEKFKELEINFKSIFRQVGVGVMLYDLNFKLQQANSKFFEMLGYTEKEYLSFETWSITHPDDVEMSSKMARELVNGKMDSYSIEKRYIHKNGAVLWVYLTATIVKNSQGFPKHIISVVQDITEQKKTEAELIYKKNELDTFVYRASHDLKGPVASLMGLYNIVKMEFGNDERIMTHFNHYNCNVMRLHEIIQNLIDLTRIKDSEMRLQKIDMREQIQKCLHSLSNLPQFDQIRIENTLQSSLYIKSDPGLLNTIVQNLVENAIKYAQPKRKESFIRFECSKQEGQMVLKVSDNGIGIPKESQDRIFQMFFRATESSNGSGLGLYLVKNALDKLGGSIQLESTAGEGSCFTVFLPINK